MKSYEESYRHYSLYEFRGKDNNIYEMEVQTPRRSYNTVRQAKDDTTVARFEKVDGHIVMVIYSGYCYRVIGEALKMDMVMPVVGIVFWDSWQLYSNSVGVHTAEDIKKGIKNEPIKDFVPCAKQWDEIFDVENLPDDWNYIIPKIAYTVCGFIEFKEGERI